MQCFIPGYVPYRSRLPKGPATKGNSVRDFWISLGFPLDFHVVYGIYRKIIQKFPLNCTGFPFVAGPLRLSLNLARAHNVFNKLVLDSYSRHICVWTPHIKLMYRIPPKKYVIIIRSP